MVQVQEIEEGNEEDLELKLKKTTIKYEAQLYQLKLDLKDMHSRLMRSEKIKEQSLKELERLECENQVISLDN